MTFSVSFIFVFLLIFILLPRFSFFV
ncbi:hypothetical protein, partial [Plasmodium yoelii yoelii]